MPARPPSIGSPSSLADPGRDREPPDADHFESLKQFPRGPSGCVPMQRASTHGPHPVRAAKPSRHLRRTAGAGDGPLAPFACIPERHLHPVRAASPPEGHTCPTGTGLSAQTAHLHPVRAAKPRPDGARRPAAHCTPALAGGARGCGAGGCWVGTMCAPTALAHVCLPIGHRDGVRHCAGSTHTAPAKHRRCGAGECGASERSASECK